MYEMLTKLQLCLTSLGVPLTPAAAAVVVVLLTIVYYLVKNRGVVPGPTGVPYFGLYPFLTDENLHLKLDAYKKKYGDIFSFTYTGRLFINMASVKAIRELHVNKSDCFAERFHDCNITVEILRNGLTFAREEPWKVLRKFFVQKFRDYGLNTVRDNMAGPVYDSLNATLEDLKSQREKPVNILQLLGLRCTVTMRKIVFGEDGVTDEELGRILAGYGGAVEGNLGVNMMLIGPFARLLFCIKPSFRRNLKHTRSMARLVLDCAKKMEASMKEEHPTCIIEEFYKERNERRRNSDPTWKYFTDKALVDSVSQFIGDGILSVSATIAGFLNALIEYPDQQEKLYAEVMEVVGANRQPAAEDRNNMPYTNAFLSEFLRKGSPVDIFPSLECTKETTVRGYRIPKGSITVMNLWSAHHDPETFENPDKFDPSRYLPSPGKPKTEPPVLFGMGKRSCSGEPFVMLQSFLFLTTIVKNFKIVSSNAPANKSVDFLLTGQLELTFDPRVET